MHNAMNSPSMYVCMHACFLHALSLKFSVSLHCGTIYWVLLTEFEFDELVKNCG